jgi:hypothetical protein
MCRSTPDLDADHRRIGAQVGELHHVALVVDGPEQEVVVGLAGQPGELAGQAVARPDGFGRLGRGDRRGRREPGLVQGRVAGPVAVGRYLAGRHVAGFFDHGENLARRGGSARRAVSGGEAENRGRSAEMIFNGGCYIICQ